ncbi:MAG TPA: phosphatase PAP2 family protein, partial [Anaeromyxobacteraceae bacterium]|nr:phosphatase PAP2 family protein [Anaeromyxobacteraceae bacterium]
MRPSERLTAAFLAALGALALLVRPPHAAAIAAAYLAQAAVPVALSRLGARGRVLSWIRDLAPAALVLVAYLLLEPVVEAANPRRLDAALAALDARWLPGLVAAWRGARGRPAWLTDAAYLAYASFYLLPLGVAVAVRARRPEEYERTVLAILLCFWASYAGYVAFPASGPRLPPGMEHAALGGGAASDLVRAFLHRVETTPLDAFPSGHTAVSLVSAAVGSRALRRVGFALWAWALAVVFSTVYVHVHYAADVVAGAALAAATLAAAPWVSEALAPRAPRPGRA